jgi:hypothetical protein
MKQLVKISASLVLMACLATALSFFGVPVVNTFATLFATGFTIGLVKHFTGINFNMPTNLAYDGFVISDTTYAGEAASSFIVKAITGNETIQGGHVYVKDGIKKTYTIPRWDADFEDFVQDRAATPTSKGTMNVTGNALTPADYMIYTEFNPRDYEAHWFATTLNPTLIDRALPITVESTVVQEVLKRHDRYLNKALWTSATTKTDIYKYYNGYLKKAALATSGTDQTNIVSTPVTLTAANIAAEFLRGWTLIPAALKYDKNMKFFCSYATYDLFMQYQIAQTYKGRDITMDGVPQFKGREVVKINDFPDNTYVIAKGLATPESNLWVGMNSTDDAKLELRPVQANSELWFIKMLMKVDVQFGWNSEIVSYNA